MLTAATAGPPAARFAGLSSMPAFSAEMWTGVNARRRGDSPYGPERPSVSEYRITTAPPERKLQGAHSAGLRSLDPVAIGGPPKSVAGFSALGAGSLAQTNESTTMH